MRTPLALVLVTLLVMPLQGRAAGQPAGATPVPIPPLSSGSVSMLSKCAANQAGMAVEPPRNLLYRTIKNGIEGRIIRNVFVLGGLVPTANLAGQAGAISPTYAGRQLVGARESGTPPIRLEDVRKPVTPPRASFCLP